LAGEWKSAPDQLKLSSPFDVSVWGPDATSVRTVDLSVRPSGEAALTVTRKVVDVRGRTIPASTWIEEAHLTIGAAQPGAAERIEHAVTVTKAIRRYPDDQTQQWPIEGLKVMVVTFADGGGETMEIRYDTAEGRGSFWETLRRQRRAPARKTGG
jgi:hypothetical protein